MTKIILSKSFILLALGSLFVIGDTAYSKENHHQLSHDQIQLSSIPEIDIAKKVANLVNDTRRRTGRLFNHQIGQQVVDAPSGNYGASFASSSSSSLSRDDTQQKYFGSEHANDASSFASFGEIPSISTVARQLNPPSDYISQPSYHTNYASTSQASNPYHSYHQSSGEASKPLGYPSNSAYGPEHRQYDRLYLNEAYGLPTSASSGLISSASHALSHWTGGFGIAEIVCTLIALAIGAIILGAPFFLIYLFLMGNFSGSGTISLANPTQSTSPTGTTTVNANGRRKRSIEEFQSAVIKHLAKNVKTNNLDSDSILRTIENLNPAFDSYKLTEIYNRLIGSIEKFTNAKV